MKKIILGVLLITCFINLRSQNSFGETSYPHSDVSIVSCGLPSRNPLAPGFIIAGHDPQSTSYNFTIDRTNTGGLFTIAPYIFQKAYQVNADTTAACNGSYPLNSCYGVSLIETTINSNATVAYAVAGSSKHGIFLSFINSNGSAAGIDYFFRWVTGPSAAGTIGKALIVQANSLYLGIWEHYWICCSKNGIVYLMDVSVNGVLISSLAYQINAIANGLILNGSGNPVIAGTINIPGNGTDGFIIEVDQSLYTINSFYSYDVGSNNQGFTSIAPMTFGNYLVGGFCDGTATGRAWIAQILSVWPYSASPNNVSTPSSDINSGEVVGVAERYNGAFQYYSTLTSTLGILVLKYTAALLPFGGSPGNEFPVNNAGNSMIAEDIDFFNNSTTGFDEGLHIFGTNTNVSPSENYLSQLYFNGINSCNTVNTFTGIAATVVETSRTATGATALSICTQISLSDANDGTRSAICGPVSSDNAGSNSRSEGTSTILENDKYTQISVYPNPSRNKFNVFSNSDSFQNVKSIYLFNSLGQKIELKTSRITPEKLELELEKYDLSNGVYFIEISCGEVLYRSKIIIE